MGGAVSACGTLSLASTGAAPDELEVRHQNKGLDPYAAPVQLFKGKPPKAPPVLLDADRIPVDLRPAPADAPWERRQPRQRQGWDRKPWAPDPSGLGFASIGMATLRAVAAAAPGVTPRKPMRRLRGDDLTLPAKDTDAAGEGGAAEAEQDAAAAGAKAPKSAVEEARDAHLRDVLHGWRTVTAFTTGRSVPVHRPTKTPDGAVRNRRRLTGSDADADASDASTVLRHSWRALTDVFQDGRAAAAAALVRASGSGAEDDEPPVEAAGGDGGAGSNLAAPAAWSSGGQADTSSRVIDPPPKRSAEASAPPTPPEMRVLGQLLRAALLTGPALCALALLLLGFAAWCAATWQADAVRRLDAEFDAAWRGSGLASPLFKASWEGDAAAVAVALTQAQEQGGNDAVAALLTSSAAVGGGALLRVRCSCVGAAATSGRAGALRALLSTRQGQPDATRAGRTLAHMAAQHYPLADAARHPRGGAAVAVLLAAGAPVTRGRGLGPAALLAHTPPLADAAARGDPDAVPALLAAGASPRSHGPSLGPWGALGKASVLWYASHASPLDDARAPGGEVVDVLLAAGASLRRGATLGPLGIVAHETPLSAAARSGATPMLRRLLDAGASPLVGVRAGPFALLGSATPVASAAAFGQADSVRTLLAVASEQGLSKACASAQLGLFGALATASPLFLAVLGAPRGEPLSATLDALLADASCDIGVGLRIGPWGVLGHITPLGMAAAGGDARSVTRLLAEGADASRCVRVLGLRLRCVPTVAHRDASAAFDDAAAQRSALLAAQERDALSVQEQARAAEQAASTADAARRLAEAERASAASLEAAERTLAAAEARRAAVDTADAGRRLTWEDVLVQDAAAAEAAATASALRMASLFSGERESVPLPQPLADGDADALSDNELAALEAWLVLQAEDAEAAIWHEKHNN